MPTKKKLTTISKTETVDNTAVFDYSSLDADTADFLRKATERIARNVLTIMSSQAEIGAILIEAHNRLANHYHGGFEKWYTSLGMSKSSVNRLIQVHEFRENLLRSSQLGQLTDNPLDLFDNLPKTLQADISSPSAPAKAVNAVLSGDIKSHKDYIAMKKRLDELQADVENLTEENNRLICENSDLEEERNDLQAENKQLRERPVDTVIVTSSASDDLDRAFNNDPTPAPASNLRFDQLKDFFEDSYERAYNELRTLYHFAKDTYPGDIREYAETRITDLKGYIENLDALYFDKDED